MCDWQHYCRAAAHQLRGIYVEGWNSASNRDAPLIPNLWKLIRRFKMLEATAMHGWRRQVNFFVYVKPTSLFVCQAGAGNLNNNRPKGNKYHSAKAIMNNIFDIIKSDPGNAYKYMEYMTMLDAAHEP